MKKKSGSVKWLFFVLTVAMLMWNGETVVQAEVTEDGYTYFIPGR